MLIKLQRQVRKFKWIIDLFVNSYYYNGIRLTKKEIYESNKVFFNGLQQELIRIRGNSNLVIVRFAYIQGLFY